MEMTMLFIYGFAAGFVTALLLAWWIINVIADENSTSMQSRGEGVELVPHQRLAV
jgi:hypothetical protein